MDKQDKIIQISILQLKNHKENTKYFHDLQGDEFELLCSSISDRGVLTPLLVVPDSELAEDTTYTVLSGHQRLRAAKELGLETLPCILLETESELDILLHANLGRRLTLTEKYRLAAHVMATSGAKKGERNDLAENRRGLTRDEIASAVGLTKDDITLLNHIKKLPTQDQTEFYEWMDADNPNRKTIQKRLRQAMEQNRKYKESDKELNHLKRRAKAHRQLCEAADKLRSDKDYRAGQFLDEIGVEFSALQTSISEQLGRLLGLRLPDSEMVRCAVQSDARRICNIMENYIAQVRHNFALEGLEGTEEIDHGPSDDVPSQEADPANASMNLLDD